MRHVLGSLTLVALMGGTLMLGESKASAQGYYGPAYGPPAPPPQRGYYAAPPRSYYYGHAHDGFFMRLTAGFGYMSASENIGGDSYSYSGMGGSFGAAFGGAIAPNLILFGEFFGTSVFDPDVTISGVSSGTLPGDMTLVGIGPGIAYYIEPINLYLSGTLAFSQVSFTDDAGNSDSTDWGLGANFMVGKEWWVARDWGIGLAGQVHLSSMHDSTYATRMSAAIFSLLFSATFN